VTPRDPRSLWHDAEPDDELGAEFFRPGRADAHAAAPCPPPEIAQAFRAGVLPADLQERLARHVEHCVVCATLVDALADQSIGSLTPEENGRILARVRAGSARPHVTGGRKLLWQASAAAAALLVMATGSVLIWQSRSAAPDPAPAQVSPPAAPPAAAPVFRLDKPAFRPPAATEPLRGRQRESQDRSELLRALEPYRASQYAEAIPRLEVFVRRHPRSAEGHFYLGVSRLFLYRDADAVTALEAAERLAKNDMYLLHETAWYLALAYRRLDDVEKAQARLEALCRAGSIRSARACAGIRELTIRHRLSGVVTAADGIPLSGATVGEYVGRMEADYAVGFTTRFSVRTDSDGRYTVSGQLARPAQSVTVRAAKPGYFTAIRVVPVAEEMRADLVLDPWVHISLGEAVTGTMKPGDPYCYYPEEPCRQFALTVPASGTLEVSVASANRTDFDLHVETPGGDVLGPFGHAPLRIAIPAVAASTFQSRILRYGEGPAEFELTTRVR
jgi:hypothetical protein